MADGNRTYPVDQFIIHHSYGPDFKDANHDTIAKWFSDIGRNRGYKGIAHSHHTYKGKETFAQAQYAGHWHNGKYCIFPIMDDPWHNVAWGAGNWKINQRAINLENCGNYLNKNFTDAQSRAVADFWRPHDKALGGKTFINPHSAVSLAGTACPARIKNSIQTIINYVNHPPKPPAPKPPAPKPPADQCKRYKDQLAAEKRITEALTRSNKELIAEKNDLIDDLAKKNAEVKTITSEKEMLEKKNDECQKLLAECHRTDETKCNLFVIIESIINVLRRKK